MDTCENGSQSPAEDVLTAGGLVNENDRILSISEVVAMASLSRRQVYREVNAGRLKMLKRGTKSGVRLGDYRAWIAEHWVAHGDAA